MDRSFLIYSEKHDSWFCGNCGMRLPMDYAYAHEHARACGFSLTDYGRDRNFVTDHDVGYRLHSDNGVLHLEICHPSLVKEPGILGLFQGLYWVTVMEAVFPPGSKTPVILKNETHVRLRAWLSYIKQGRCCKIHAEPDATVIHRVFPGILDIFSLEMFAHIYRTKGYQHVKLLTEQEAWKIMAVGQMLPGQSPNHLRVNLLRARGNTLILRITIDRGYGHRPIVFLFSRGYAACTHIINIRDFLQADYRMNDPDSEKSVIEFAHAYPEYNLEQYMERSTNILVPLMALDYHPLLELAVKTPIPAP